MSLDVVVILVALAVVAPANVLLSAMGAVVLNIVLAFNHRPAATGPSGAQCPTPGTRLRTVQPVTACPQT